MSAPLAAPARRRSRWAAVVVGVAGVAVVAVLLAVALGRGSGSGSGTGNASATAFDLPALQGGGRVRLAAYRGTPVVVTLFASWCTACETELPTYGRTAAGLRGRVQFIGVDSQETGDGAAFARRFSLAADGFALARDRGLYGALSAHGLPLTAFYGRDGALLAVDNAALPKAELQRQLARFYGM